MQPSVEQTVDHLFRHEAAIAWLHATAQSFEATEWKAIHYLYTVLYAQHPKAIIALNKAIAASYAVDKPTAICELAAIKGLENHYLYHTAMGQIYFEWGRMDEAGKYYGKALVLTSSTAERQLLQNKIEACYPLKSTDENRPALVNAVAGCSIKASIIFITSTPSSAEHGLGEASKKYSTTFCIMGCCTCGKGSK